MAGTIGGIVPPMVTPFTPDGSIDEGTLREEARHLIEEAGVHGLAVGGSTGEGHTLSTDESRRATAIVGEEAAGRVPVITGVIVDSTALAIERGRGSATWAWPRSR
jgi:4-hydroxy-tetrahydrodipicolinate synthase